MSAWTDEQVAIIEAFQAGKSVVADARAGCGKTSTTRGCAQSMPNRRGIFMAFNKAIAGDAQASFPPSCSASTIHSLAFRSVGHQYADRLNSARVTSYDAAKFLNFNKWMKFGLTNFSPPKTMRVALETVSRFCHSDSSQIMGRHVPWIDGIKDDDRDDLIEVVVPLARKAWADMSARHGSLRFTHDCQPPGTLVRKVTNIGGRKAEWEDVPIETIEEGDQVVSFSMKTRRGYIRRAGRRVNKVGQREFKGQLVKVASGGETSRYTPEHICVVRLDSDLSEGNHVVYLAKRGEDFRIGRTTWRTRSQHNTLGIRRRAESQGADQMWILGVYETDKEAAFNEALLSWKHRIPTWQFFSKNETMPLGQFWAIAGRNRANAMQCLDQFGLDLQYPFWGRSDGWGDTRRPIKMRAMNLRPGMLMLNPDEIKPHPSGGLFANDGSGAWHPISIKREPYSGTVYNLDVEEDHTYIADGIATHNCYLKLWSMSDPVLDCDYLIFDEAQDSSPVITHVVQIQEHAQKLVVGDPQQQIYEWRGAVDAMGSFGIDTRLPLAQSFRFGKDIADEANRWLNRLGAKPLVRGSSWIDSRVGALNDHPKAVLCRTNAQVFAEVMELQTHGIQPAVVGGVDPIISFANAADDLMNGKTTGYHDLQGFKDWEQVKSYVSQDFGGKELQTFVTLLDKFKPNVIISIMQNCLPETVAEVIVSTAHKAKGREWDTVRIAEDFSLEPKKDAKGELQEPPDGEIRLAYVAATRAKFELDASGLYTPASEVVV